MHTNTYFLQNLIIKLSKLQIKKVKIVSCIYFDLYLLAFSELISFIPKEK